MALVNSRSSFCSRAVSIMSDSVITMSVDEYIAHRDLQVLGKDTDLSEFQFALTSVEWHRETPNDGQYEEQP